MVLYNNIISESDSIMKDKELADYQFIISPESYFIKLYSNMKINKFDLLLNGNMGYDGSFKTIKRIDNICKSNRCIFYVKKEMLFDDGDQFNIDIYNYPANKYNFIYSNSYFNVYSNYLIDYVNSL